jgi:hypothetical protein
MGKLQIEDIRGAVRENYGKVAGSVIAGCCCSGSSCCGKPEDVTAEDISIALGYSGEDVTAVPEGANMGLGCGNPTAIAVLKLGETVLDLGSGGGFDCFQPFSGKTTGFQRSFPGAETGRTAGDFRCGSNRRDAGAYQKRHGVAYRVHRQRFLDSGTGIQAQFKIKVQNAVMLSGTFISSTQRASTEMSK